MTLVTKKDSNEILKDYLKSHGITQHYVATKIGMSDLSRAVLNCHFMAV